MKAEIEIEFRGKWLCLPVDYEYQVSYGVARVDCVMYGTEDITAVMDEMDMFHLNQLAQKHHSRMEEIHRVNRDARIARDRESGLAEIRAEDMRNDLVANARAGR